MNQEIRVDSVVDGDVICLFTDMNAKQHRPMKEYDVISGRYTFTTTVCLSKHVNLSNS